MSDSDADIDRILDDAYLADIAARSMDDLRTMRAECDEVESELSYGRRMLQGRIDILSDELRLRGEGHTSTPSELIDRMSQVLADDVPVSANPRGNRLMTMISGESMAKVDENVEVLLGMPLGDVAGAPTDEVEAALDRLRDAENDLSKRRRELHRRLDAIQGELARRYRDGEADVSALLRTD